MPSLKRLRSVCQSIAHHAASGLSYLHPHVAHACRDQGIEKVTINLLESDGGLESRTPPKPLITAIRSLFEKFQSIYFSEGLSLGDLTVASISLAPDKNFNDDYCTICEAQLGLNDGRSVRYVVNCLGTVISKGREREGP